MPPLSHQVVPLHAGQVPNLLPQVEGPEVRAFLADQARTLAHVWPPQAGYPRPGGTAATATGFDSVTATALPAGGRVYYAYINGAYANLPAVQARVAQVAPGAKIRTISVLATEPADMLDCEPGNCQPQDCPGWYDLAKSAGVEIPEIYCPADWTTAVRTALTSTCQSTDNYFLHSAHYGIGAHICGACGYPAADNTQWTDVGTYDINLLGARYVTWLYPAPPTPPPTSEDSMISDLFTAPNGNLHVAEVTSAGALLDHFHIPGNGNTWTTRQVAVGADPAVPPSYSATSTNAKATAGGINLVAAKQGGGFLWSYAHPAAAWSPAVTVGG